MKYEWKILDVYATDGAITSAKYHCTVSDDDNSVETEGYWSFPEAKATIPFEDVTEEMIAGWIEEASIKDGKSVITSRLEEQLKSLDVKPVPAPWMPQVFTPDL